VLEGLRRTHERPRRACGLIRSPCRRGSGDGWGDPASLTERTIYHNTSRFPCHVLSCRVVPASPAQEFDARADRFLNLGGLLPRYFL
jgi:hypothetical protein